MMYLHDIWVNWFEGEENGYNICEFHEWRKTDEVQLLDQVPLLKVSSELMEYIENNLIELPEDLLNDVYYKAYLRKNHERLNLEYTFVICDGKRSLAVDTIGYKIPIRKSRLIPRQHQLALEMVNSRSVSKYKFNKDYVKNYSSMLLHPRNMAGLTRRERALKQLLLMALENVKINNNIDELKYYFVEFNPSMYSYIKNLDYDEIYDLFINELVEGWTERHENLCSILVRSHPFFEKIYESEMEMS